MPKYKLREAPPADALAELASYPSLLAGLLAARGITTKEAAENFLNPSYDAHIHDPFLMPDMAKAVERILSVMEKGERIVIWSDYDCDGIPGGALFHDFFKKIEYPNFGNYIPHRHEEGYGLNIAGLEKLASEETRLVITVDCGITDIGPVARANELGIDVIITDHHLPGEKLPDAFAVINVKRADSAYPFDGLCGAATAWKLVQALIMRGKERMKWDLPLGWEKWLLDLAGLATIADMMPLVGENRALAHFGLKVMRKGRRAGLRELCGAMRTDIRNLTEDDIGFMVAPRINAASRMDKPEDAFELLTTPDSARAKDLATHLNKMNDQRKGVVAATVKEIKHRVREREEKNIIVMGDPLWRPGLLGLAANSVVEEFNRPVFLWGREGLPAQAGGDTIKGSCRSDGSVNVVELMSVARDVFIDFGGHRFSGGFSVTHEKVHLLEERLMLAYTEVKTRLPAQAGEPVEESVTLDGTLALDDVSDATYRLIEQLAPFGEGNPKPLFLFERVPVASVRQFGKENQHLELTLTREGKAPVKAIAFFTGTDAYGIPLEAGKTIDLVAHLERSYFLNRPALRLRIVGIMSA